MISEMFQCIHRRVLPEIGKYIMLHIFQRMQQFLQRVLACMEQWCSLCKVILQLMFAILFSFIINREHIT